MKTESIMAVTIPLALVLIFGGLIFGITYENVTESEFENCIEECDYIVETMKSEVDCMVSCHEYFSNVTEVK